MHNQIDSKGWYVNATHLPSPHFDARPDGEVVDLLVIHNISLPPGKYGSGDIERLFLGELEADKHPFYRFIATARVSAHCLIARDGTVTQFVSFEDRAWHAGVSAFAGRTRCNDYSIGIELEGTDLDTFTAAQYQSLAALSQSICAKYPNITQNRITGHQFIAPQRKTDPGLCFDWQRYLSML